MTGDTIRCGAIVSEGIVPSPDSPGRFRWLYTQELIQAVSIEGLPPEHGLGPTLRHDLPWSRRAATGDERDHHPNETATRSASGEVLGGEYTLPREGVVTVTNRRFPAPSRPGGAKNQALNFKK